MPIIKCTVGEDGKLIPSTVEFEPGDTIRFRSDHPVHLDGDLTEIEVRRAFNLDEISAEIGLELEWAVRRHGACAFRQLEPNTRIGKFLDPFRERHFEDLAPQARPRR